jgi:hypothetical protein
MVEVRTKQGLKRAILSGEDEIKIINPKLEKWILLIHGIKQAAWAVAIVMVAAGITTAIVITAASGGVAAPVAGASGLAATGGAALVVGIPAAIAMVSLGIALGGVSGLKAIRENYRVKSKKKGNLVLSKKTKRKSK